MSAPYVYADNAATTRLCPEALDAMMPFLTKSYGNPSSLHRRAAEPREALRRARETVAGILHAEPDEIVFTSGGTESDNIAVQGAATADPARKRIITTGIEHPAVLRTARRLEAEGCPLSILPVDGSGRVDPESLRRAITPDTALVSVMTANNEVGTIEPIDALGAICREAGVTFHTDAVQAVGHIPLDVSRMNVDLLSASAHKFNGPRGVGFLYVRRGSRVRRLMEGGGQENGWRSGTENVAGAVGLAAALRAADQRMRSDMRTLALDRDELFWHLLNIPGVCATGSRTNRLPGHVSIAVRGVSGESLALLLDLKGFAVSAGSACASGKAEPSHVLTAMGIDREDALGALRITFGRYNQISDVSRIGIAVAEAVETLRKMNGENEK